MPEKGLVDHASVSLGSVEEGSPVHIQLSQSDTKVINSGWLYLRIGSEIDQLYEIYKSKGVKIVQELGDMPWGMREFSILDDNGHQFRFGMPI